MLQIPPNRTSRRWSILLFTALVLAGSGIGQDIGDPSGLTGSYADGIPALRVGDYSQSVRSWWDAHLFNPDNGGFDPSAVVHPSPRVTIGPGESLQAAIDALPAAGGTIELRAGSYDAFDLIGRSNVHLVTSEGAIIRGGPSWIAPCTLMKDYSAFDRGLDQGDHQYWSCFTGMVRNIYFEGIIFDGGGTATEGVWLKRAQDVVFYNITMRNYAYTNEFETSRNLGMIASNTGVDNVWVIASEILGSGPHAVYLDGAHGSGVVDTLIDHTATKRGALVFFTNDDFTEDIDGDGIYSEDEQRSSKFISIDGNTLIGNVYAFSIIQGEKAIVQDNTVTGSIWTMAQLDSRVAMSHPQVQYSHRDFEIVGNTANRIIANANQGFLYLNHQAMNKDPDLYNISDLGEYRLIDNRVEQQGGIWVHQTSDQIVGPNVEVGNCMGASCAPLQR